MKKPFSTPIVFFIYKRPEITTISFKAIKRLQPKQLFIIADGPKSQTEKTFTDQTREIVSHTDWPCNIKTNFADSNQGLRKRVVSGLNWVFQQVDRAIIIEDDCLASLDFFQFCETLLIKYQNTPQIMSISGVNFQFHYHQITNSYYFSQYPHSWGWATWKRAWKMYDDKLADWPTQKASAFLSTIFKDKIISDYWTYILDKTFINQIDSWAYRWTYSHFRQRGLSIIPAKNLVSNLGFGRGATHTLIKDRRLGMKLEKITIPLNHPSTISIDKIADSITEKTVYVNWKNRLIIMIKKLLKI